MTIDLNKLANSLRAAADAIDGGMSPAQAPTGPAAAPAEAPKRRGRPPAGEAPAATAPAAAPAVAPAATGASAGAASTSPSDDPFADKPAAPVHTLEDVRTALKALQTRTDQATAVAVMKKFAASFNELKPEQFAALIAATLVGAPADDPFGSTPAPAAAEVKLTEDDVRKACVDAQKRTSADKVQKIVMDNGGAASPGEGKPVGPNLAVLPAANYAKVIAELAALPTTK